MNDHFGQLGKYRLVRLLGSGGFAKVYLGEHTYLKKLAAIKVLPVQLDSDTMAKFLKEAQVIARLDHPHIIPVLEFDVDEATDIPYLVMAYAPNGTLRHHYNGKKVAPIQLASMIKQIASALQHAHTNKIIHRDIKPENILLSKENQLLLSDFGLAVIAQSTIHSDKGGGTMAYSAPEQINGKPCFASDQYSLAVMAYELLCGVRPFNGSYTQLIAQHLQDTPRPLNDHVPSIPSAINIVIQKALSKEPRQRFANVMEFAEKLELACNKREFGSRTSPAASPLERGGKASSVVATPPQDSSVIWNVPYTRNPFFTGREPVLHDIHKAFLADRAVSMTLALSGLGGVGKTQLALEYAYRYHKDYRYILWVRCERKDLQRDDYNTIIAQLRLPDKHERTADTIKNWLRSNTNWLLIVDNIADLDQLRTFVPSTGRGHVLLTTRTQATGHIARGIDLHSMEREEAILFLLRRIKMVSQDAPLANVARSDLEKAKELAEQLGYLPLALDQAGAYIEEAGCSMADYLLLYSTHFARLLAMRGSLFTDHPTSVTSTFTQSFEKLEQTNPVAADLLRFCIFLHPESIPEKLLTFGASELGPHLQPLAREPLLLHEAVAALRKYSLVKRDAETKTLSIHPLVQAVLKDGMSQEQQREWAERTVRAVNLAFSDIEEVQNWACCQQCIAHLHICVALIEQWKIVSPPAVRILVQASMYLHVQAEYAQAEILLKRITVMLKELQNRQVELPPNATIKPWHYYERGKYTTVEPQMREELAQVEQQLGNTHPYVAIMRLNQALLYYKLARYEDAEQLFYQSLSIKEQHVGLDHSCVACNFSGLGSVSTARARYSMAEVFFQYSLDVWEQMPEPRHPYMGRCLNGLAQLAMIQGNYAKAEEYLRRERSVLDQVLRPQHPSIAYHLNDWASLCLMQGRYDQAEMLLDQAQSHIEKTVGLKHPIAACIFLTLARYYAIGHKYRKAEALLQEALAIREQALGPKHPAIANTIHALADVYVAVSRQHAEQRRLSLAEALYNEALIIRKNVFGEEHPDIAHSLNGLGELYFDLPDYDRAEHYYKQALAMREHFFGGEHPDVAQTLHNLARLYRRRKCYEEAEPLFKRALAIREKTLGPEHPDVGTTLSQYTFVLWSLNRRVDATHFLNRARHIREKYNQLHTIDEDP